MGGNGYKHGGDKYNPKDKALSYMTGNTKDQQRITTRTMANSETVGWARHDGHQWQQNMDPQARDAFRQYTSNEYQNINKALRGGASTKDSVNASLMQQELLKARTTTPMKVYRGVDETLTWDQAKSIVGAQFTEAGFSSTSLDFKTGLQFNGPQNLTGNYNVVREITMPTGSRAGYVGGAEKEMILPANSRFQITGVQRVRYNDALMGTNDAVIIVKMKYLGPAGMRGRPRKA